MIQLSLNSSRIVAWIKVSVSKSTEAVASSICTNDQRLSSAMLSAQHTIERTVLTMMIEELRRSDLASASSCLCP